LVNFLLKKGHIGEASNCIEVNESCGNQAFSTEEMFVKVSPDADNLRTEYDSLAVFDSVYFPKALFYEQISDASDTYFVL
jgi:hypothetical protein